MNAQAASPALANLIADAIPLKEAMHQAQAAAAVLDDEASEAAWRACRAALQAAADEVAEAPIYNASDALIRAEAYVQLLDCAPGADLRPDSEPAIHAMLDSYEAALRTLATLDDHKAPKLTVGQVGCKERWDRQLADYLAAKQASDDACDREAEWEGDDLPEGHQEIHDCWAQARRALLETPAPHWRAMAEKTRAFINYMEEARWVVAARDFIVAAEEAGDGDPAKANNLSVLKARGHAEQIAYFLANSPDGYANYACGLGQIAQLAEDAEALVSESRKMAALEGRKAFLSAQVITAVWFSEDEPETAPAMAA